MKMQPRISFSVDSLLGRKTYKKPAVGEGITDLKKEEEEEGRDEEKRERDHHPSENQDRRLEDDASYVGHDSSGRLPERGESEEEEEEEEDDLNVDDDDEEEDEDEEDDKERLQLPLHHPLHLPLPLPHLQHAQGLPPTPNHQLLSSLSSSSPPSPLLRPPFPPPHHLSPSSPRLPFVPGFNPAMFDKGTILFKIFLVCRWQMMNLEKSAT